MKMKALDSFCAAEVGMQHAGAEFQVDEARGKEFAARGLAVQIEEIEVADEPAAEEQAVEQSPVAPKPAKRAKAKA